MSKNRRNHFKALALLAVVSVTAAGSAAGQGYAGPVLTPSSLDFGSVLVGTTSAVQDVSVSAPNNNRGNTLSIASIVLPTGYARSGGTCPASGAVATPPCTIGVVFAPTAVGPLAGNMVVTASINGTPAQPANVALVGAGVPGVSVSAPSLSTWGLGLLVATLMTAGLVFVRKR